jgi:hypothetical protein
MIAGCHRHIAADAVAFRMSPFLSVNIYPFPCMCMLHLLIWVYDGFQVAYFLYSISVGVGPVAQSVQRLATGWTVRGSNPGGGEIFLTCPDRLGGHPASYTMGTGYFPGLESDRGVTLTPPLKQSRAIPLLSLRAFVACKKGETYLLLKANCL